MTTSTFNPVIPKPKKSSWLSGCFVIALIILFAILGVYNFVSGSIIAYVFSSAGMFSFASTAIVLIAFCECAIYFFLVFRIKKTALAYLVGVGDFSLVCSSFAF